MERIINVRSSGKTHKLMIAALENNAIIACSNPIAMREKAHAYGLTGIDFVPYSDLFNGNIDPKANVMIDEIEECMRAYCDGCLVGYTLTAED